MAETRPERRLVRDFVYRSPEPRPWSALGIALDVELGLEARAAPRQRRDPVLERGLGGGEGKLLPRDLVGAEGADLGGLAPRQRGAADHVRLVDQGHHPGVGARIGADEVADLDPQLRLLLGLAARTL